MYLEFAAEAYLDKHAIKPQAFLPDMSNLPLIDKSKIDLSNTDMSKIDPSNTDMSIILATEELFRYILTERLNGTAADELAYRFHAGLAAGIIAACEQARKQTGLSTCALSGGVFQNQLLVTLVKDSLIAQGFTVLLHSLVPPNDGGICLGQAVAAMVHLNQ